MTRDHVEVARLTADLQRVRDSMRGVPDAALQRELQRILYGLYAIIRLHFDKEEEVYLPLLDAGLALAEADDMFRAMHESVSAGGSAPHPAEHHHPVADQ
jgi:hemerythrin-like domain-containing protein